MLLLGAQTASESWVTRPKLNPGHLRAGWLTVNTGLYLQ